ncbi:succinate dehydrogenase, hydrophobic membrane anchor protein [Rickettsiales endosymbiont of Stachyamoeba lipophora]|uniref:succinate dehydrogenase, hydrophobic membrane anchor protein n=1 Tax=Rickettsiales endosymbiont of Stachyamoeba lipophora TaxID=2486578 RepID=UPI0013DE2736|nr:succinate dehydrogenase, hydrophobic membrane anchor protein [Rickettsiales endosymbiont of Stachyamoeba lipophora]
MKKSAFITPLARVRGLGSARSGVGHYIHQRLSAVLMIPLCLWLVYFIVTIAHSNLEEIVFVIAGPLNAFALVLFMSASLYHGMLGIKVIIEDYVHCECIKSGLITGLYLVSYITIIAGVISVLGLHFKYYLA